MLLGESGVEQTRLLLLTRYPETFGPDGRPDLELRWFEVADWLEAELPEAQAAGDIPGFLVHQLLDFLEARSMTLAQVGKFMPEGLRALSNLMNMLVEAAGACKVAVKKGAGWDYMGVELEKGKYWVGVQFTAPEKLWFGTKCRIDPAAADKLGVGERTGNWKSGYYSWWKSIEMDSEEVHFFSRSKVSQMQWLEEFLRESLTQVKSIETPDQPPIAEEPADGN